MRVLSNIDYQKTETIDDHRRRTGSLGSDALKDIVDEAVEDRHGFVGDTSVGVDLLEDYQLQLG